MTTEHSEFDSGKNVDWLEGLAGRGSGTPDSDEGRRIRQALLDDAGSVSHGAPDWSAIAALAQNPERVVSPQIEAANEGRSFTWNLRQAWAAVLVLTVGLTLWILQPAPQESTMRGAGGSGHAIWLSPTPRESATSLADELLKLGAAVEVSEAAPQQWRMVVSAEPAHRQAVNARLADISAALDAQGHELILVRLKP